MVPRTVVNLASLAVVSWPVAVPAGDMSWVSGLDLRWVSGLLAAVALVALVRFMTVELRHEKLFARRIVLLGAGPMGLKLVEELAASDDHPYVISGVIDAEQPPAPDWNAVRWLGAPDQLGEIVEAIRPSTIVVSLADRRSRLPMQSLLHSRARGVAVEDAVTFYERLTGKIAIEALTPSVLILSDGFRNHGLPRNAARAISVAFAVVGLVFVAPIIGLLALAIKLDSRGPVFFVQDRAGRDGRPFRLLKLRTMHPCDERPSEWVQDNTDRITRIGGWLRRFRIDELPQLINVLRGDMNLIGPRPHPTCNQRIFMERIAYYGLRSTVLPGVTGWAQVRYGYANNLEQETEKMRYDLYYIKNHSLWLDARIAMETLLILALGHGSSGVRTRNVRERWTAAPESATPTAIVPIPVGGGPIVPPGTA